MLDAGNEHDPLLNTPNKNKQKSKETNNNEWNVYHTVFAIIIRIIGDLFTKTIVVYYRDYEQALNLDDTQFSYVIIFGQIGALLAVLTLPLINKLLTKLQHKIAVFGFLCGFFGVLFCIPSQLQSKNTDFVLIWCCTDRLFFGMSFFIFITSILDLAANINMNSGKRGKIISLLSLSWTFASLFYFVIGVMIQYINWWFSFALFGCILCILSIISYYVFTFNIESSSLIMSPVYIKKYIQNLQKQPQHEQHWLHDLKLIFSSNICVSILFAAIIMGIFNGSFTVILSSIWLEDVFNLNSFQVGCVCLTMFCGELLAALSVSNFVDKYGVFTVSFIPFFALITASICCCLLSFYIGPEVGGIPVVIAIIFIQYAGWESYFITNQVLCIDYAPNKHLISLMLLMNFLCLNIGNIIGTRISPVLWNNGQGMYIINIIWIVCTGSTALIYSILKHLTQTANQFDTQTIVFMEDE